MKKRSRAEINPEITDVHQKLYEAICAGELLKVQHCLGFAPDVNIHIEHWTLLYHAIHRYSDTPHKMTPIIDALIKAGANVYLPCNRGGFVPIYIAMKEESIDLLNTLLEALKFYCAQNQKSIGDYLFPALRRAIISDINPEMLRLLLESGADPNPGEDSPSLLLEILIKGGPSNRISQKISYLLDNGLSYEKQIIYTQLVDFCRDYAISSEPSDDNNPQNTLLGLAIKHRQFEVLNSLITSLQEMGIQPVVQLYEDLIFYAAENTELSRADIEIILSHTIKDDFTEAIFKTLVMIRWPIDNILDRLKDSEVTEISGELLTECMSLIKQRLKSGLDSDNEFAEEVIDDTQIADDYLLELIDALAQEEKLADDIVKEGTEFLITIQMNRQQCNQNSSPFEESDSDPADEIDIDFRPVMNPISYAVYANYSKTLKRLLKLYPDDIEQTLDLESVDVEVFPNHMYSISLQKFSLLCKSFDSLKVLIKYGANVNAVSVADFEDAPEELINYWKSVRQLAMIRYDPDHHNALWQHCPHHDANFNNLLDSIDSYRKAIYSDNKLNIELAILEISDLISSYNSLSIIAGPAFTLISLALTQISRKSPITSKMLITANNRTIEDYTNNPLLCYFEGTYYYLPGDYLEKDYLEHLTMRLLTKFTYHLILAKLKSLGEIKKSHTKLIIMRSVLYRLDNNLSTMNLSQLTKYQEKKEQELGDFFGDDLSEDSDEEEERIFIQNMPMVIRMTESYATELQAIAQVEKLRVGKSGKIKEVAGISVKRGDLKLMIEHKGGTVLRDKEQTDRPKFLSAADIDLEAHKRVINSGIVDFKQYPLAKINFPGHKIKNSTELEAHAQSELDNLNRLFLLGKFDEAMKQVSAPFSTALARGVHYATNEWSADDRRQHRSAVEIGKPHFAAAIYEQTKKPITTNLLTLDTIEQQEMLEAAKQLAKNLSELKKQGQDPKSEWYMFYAAIQQWYTGKYDDFHQLLDIAMFNKVFIDESDKLIASKLKSVLFNAKNPMLSTADTPYHALKYAYGIKSYPGQFDSRLRPRYRKDGRPERNKTGKVYIYLLTIEQYLRLNPNHVTSMAKAGDIDVISTIRPERETSFYGYIPEGALIIQHVAKYPSFNKPYRKIYHHKYGLDEVLYNLFKKDFLESTPHSDKRRSVKLLLGEWLCVYHETRLLREVVQKIKDDGRLLLYRGLDMPFRFSPPDVASRNNSAGSLERAVNKNPKTAQWTELLTGFFNRGKTTARKAADTAADQSSAALLEVAKSVRK